MVQNSWQSEHTDNKKMGIEGIEMCASQKEMHPNKEMKSV